ncbi:hypothetical protein B0H13DRAFT_2134423, partial [Mycena leptocephala]
MSSGHIRPQYHDHQAEIHKSNQNMIFMPWLALLNVAEIDVHIGAPKEDVQGVYEKAREIFSTRNLVTELFSLREANFLTAKTLFERCLKLSRLGNAMFLVHSCQAKEKLGIHKALQFLGDASLLRMMSIQLQLVHISQAKQVENIDQRLAGVSEDVLEQHRKNLAHLSDIEDMEGLDLEDESTLDP